MTANSTKILISMELNVYVSYEH